MPELFVHCSTLNNDVLPNDTFCKETVLLTGVAQKEAEAHAS